MNREYVLVMFDTDTGREITATFFADTLHLARDHGETLYVEAEEAHWIEQSELGNEAATLEPLGIRRVGSKRWHTIQ